MENMATTGFLVAGLTIIGLLRVLFAFRELRAELLRQARELARVSETLEALSAGAALACAHDARLADLESRINVTDRAAREASFDEAARLVAEGITGEKLAARCGLSRGEAALASALWSRQADEAAKTASEVN